MTPWRTVSYSMVLKLPHEWRITVHRGEVIAGRYGMPELVTRVMNSSTKVMTRDQQMRPWLRFRGVGKQWLVFPTLKEN